MIHGDNTYNVGFCPPATGTPNIIAVVANRNSFDLYVNRQKIATASDITFSHGFLGFLAENQGNSTDVIYSNAKVWTI